MTSSSLVVLDMRMCVNGNADKRRVGDEADGRMMQEMKAVVLRRVVEWLLAVDVSLMCF